MGGDSPSHMVISEVLPPGKHTKTYGKSPFLMGKLTISMAIFSSYVKLPEVLTHPHISLEVAIFRSEPQNTLANWL